jgi:DNA-directed RNA polymerase specialized sigma24 family protein
VDKKAQAPPAGRGRFATTHWSMVLAAGGTDSSDAHEALTTLCQLYWYPLYAYARRSGYPGDQAEDLVQAFFMRVLEKNSLRLARAERGRFRSFLLVAFKHFVLNEYDRARAAKRGGGAPIDTLDVSSGEGRYSMEPRDDVTPEALFERQWAQTLIERAQVRLRGVFVRGGNGVLFEHLKDFATGQEDDTSCRAIGAALRMSDGAVRVAIHRLRRRFRDLLRDEIGQTVEDPAEIDEEVAFLLATVSAAGPRGFSV